MARQPLVISARVTARLLGIRLLTLDACITASDAAPVRGRLVPGSAGATWPGPAAPLGRARPARAIRPARAVRPAGGHRAMDTVGPARAGDPADPARSGWNARIEPGAAPGSSVARARELADQGARALAQGRRRH